MTLKVLSLSMAMLMTAHSLNAAPTTSIPEPGKKIVGGEEATEGDWPWMSALVVTFDGVVTSLNVGDDSFDTEAFNFSPSGQATGQMSDCGIGDEQCDASGKICVIERGEINFSVKAENCEAGGGVGAVIYNNDEGTIQGTLGEDFAGTIPVVAVTQEDGKQLLTMLDSTATIDVAANPVLQQRSSCGASFLGDRWVLTASHCVEGLTAEQVKVNVGEFDLDNGAENAITAKNIYMHADYDTGTLDNDIALIELSESSDVEAISLANTDTTSQYEMEKSLATVIGWGGREGYAPGEGPTSDFPLVLHQVELELFTAEECKQTLADSQSITTEQTGITEQMICAGTQTGGKGSCQGDSGGPLVVQTGEGWQQFGVVSWGIGCAAEGYPGVYARVSSFIDWIDSIKGGIAIEQNLNFGITAVASATEANLKVVNNSTEAANLTFAIDGAGLSVDGSECAALEAGASCELKVTYNPTEAGETSSYITVTSDNEAVTTSRALVTASSLAAADDLESSLSANDAIKWFSGGEAVWAANGTAGAKSGTITHLESSILLAQVTGEGTLSFDWSVSSEENKEDPDRPYDALYVYVNGQLIDFISGEVDFTNYEINLADGVNYVYWAYVKDPAATEGDDAGYLKSVTFTGGNDTSPTTPAVTTPTNENARKRSRSALSMGWMLLFAPALVWLRRRKS